MKFFICIFILLVHNVSYAQYIQESKSNNFINEVLDSVLLNLTESGAHSYNSNINSKIEIKAKNIKWAGFDIKDFDVIPGFPLSIYPKEENKIYTITCKLEHLKNKEDYYRLISSELNEPINPPDSYYSLFDFIDLSGIEIDVAGIRYKNPLFYNDKIYNYGTTLPAGDSLIISFTGKSKIYPVFNGEIKVNKEHQLIYFTAVPSNEPPGYIKYFKFIQKYKDSTGNSVSDYYKMDVFYKIYLLEDVIDFENEISVKLRRDNISYETPNKKYSDISLSEIIFHNKETAKIKNQLLKDRISNFYIKPYADYNRVNALSLGLEPSLEIKDFKYKVKSYYSFGLNRIFGEISFSQKVSGIEFITAKLNLFSKVDVMYNDITYSRIFNSLTAFGLHDDYYDYYLNEGWSLGFSGSHKQINWDISYTNSYQSSLHKTTDLSIFSDEKWRENPAIEDGKYAIYRLNFRFRDEYRIYLIDKLNYNIFINTVFGARNKIMPEFASIEGKLYTSIPLYSTGYDPLSLDLLLHAGRGSEHLPVHHRFRMHTNLSIFSNFGDFISAPEGIYGDRNFHTFSIRLNISDLWWRYLDFPLYYGRGLNFSFIFSTGYLGRETSFLKYFSGPFENYYSEAGFSLSKIPILISNSIFLTTNLRWGIGPVAAGRFGWSISYDVPFEMP